MAVSYWARNQLGDTFEMSMPGMFALKRDAARLAQTNPLPINLGPICEHCWLKRGRIRTVSDPRCPHGGPRQGEHRNTATTASHGERRPSDPDRCKVCTRRQCDTRECRCPCHPDNYRRSLFGGAR